MSDNPSDDKLPEVVAGFEMLTVTNASSSPSNPARRVLRKRLPKPVVSSPEGGLLNRRCTQRPKKRTFNEMESDEDVKVYYLDKSVKRSPHTLETIFEEDEKINVESTSQPQMSAKKIRRMIDFEVKAIKGKQKKRRLKIKKFFGSKLFRSGLRLDMKDVLEKLELMRSSSPVGVEHEE